ncbi:hypothetical protein [Dyella sp. 2RAB6]|uniref:hypothetical protein n=1 Tax=Dyella sp. 2RAB6 TaxID=3232992 RepID=UPI003F917107
MNQREERKGKETPQRPVGTSGYAEPRPAPNRKGQVMPDAHTPHEPQNNPRRKPKPSP